jgi:hypothetical protein
LLFFFILYLFAFFLLKFCSKAKLVKVKNPQSNCRAVGFALACKSVSKARTSNEMPLACLTGMESFFFKGGSQCVRHTKTFQSLLRCFVFPLEAKYLPAPAPAANLRSLNDLRKLFLVKFRFCVL